MVDEEEKESSVEGFPQATFHRSVEDARKRLREFYQPSYNRHKQEMSNIQPMSMSKASEKIFYQTLQVDTEALLTEQARKELEYEIPLGPGVPCILGYGSDSD